MPGTTGTKAPKSKTKPAKSYKHPETKSPMQPGVGTQPQFKKKLPPKTYKYDSSLSPVMEWDWQNPAREQGEALLRQVMEADSLEQAKAAASKLKAISKPNLYENLEQIAREKKVSLAWVVRDASEKYAADRRAASLQGK